MINNTEVNCLILNKRRAPKLEGKMELRQCYLGFLQMLGHTYETQAVAQSKQPVLQ